MLDALFGFLHRRTDFFYEMEPGDKMGFPPGVAESMVSFDKQLLRNIYIFLEVSIRSLTIIKLYRSTNISRSIKTLIIRNFHISPTLNKDGKLIVRNKNNSKKKKRQRKLNLNQME